MGERGSAVRKMGIKRGKKAIELLYIVRMHCIEFKDELFLNISSSQFTLSFLFRLHK